MNPSQQTKEKGQPEDTAGDAVAVETTRHKGHRSQQARPLTMTEKLLLLAVAILAIAVLVWLPVLLWGWRYVAEQWKRMQILFGEPTFLLIHLATYLSVAFGPWLLQKYKKEPKTALEVLTVILVVIVLFVNTWNVTTTTRHVVAERAEEMCDESFTYTYGQLGASPRATSDIVILDQGITKAMSYLYVVVRNEFPEFELRTASLHMVPPAPGNHSEEVWDIIQEGSQRKDREFMSYPADSNPGRTSLVGQTIKEGTIKYCQDIAHPEQGENDCKNFQPPLSGDTEYRSLICLPLKTGLSTEIFASVCFDSKADHAFDKKIELLKDRIDKQMSELSSLLQLYRKQGKLIFQDSQPEAQPIADSTPRREDAMRHR
jgi:hypothetical protein